MLPAEIIKKIRQIEIRTSRIVSDVFAGQYKSVFKGHGMEFHEVREYVPGDDVRAIDWNVTARLGHPFIKKYIEERELTVMLLVDMSGSQHFGSGAQFKQDLAAELAGILAFAAIQSNDRVGLILFTGEVEHFIPPRKGTRHVLRVIRDTLHYKPRGKKTDIAKALAYLNRVTTRKCVAFLISDFQDTDYIKPLAAAARRHDLIAVRLRDRRETEWPAAGLVELEDAETGERILVDTSDRRVQERLRQRSDEVAAARARDLRGAGVDLIELETNTPYVQQLIRFFRARERRVAS
ncbi:MAG: DUF58 domain-containing protein [Kiritimatiellae bacterium]|nr:DUF58 domain-containing protein [Kiritimatiellia bacterium]MCO5062484.1 DUF58 domain-containing protein [Kiritimatiellia bacterium]MCO5068348.1 DUF58 domain-containing protein [Kiritimatiellia bacterium]